MTPNSDTRLGIARSALFAAVHALLLNPGKPELAVELEQRFAEYEDALTNQMTIIANANVARDRQRDKRLDALDDAVLGSRRSATHRPPGHSDEEDPTGSS